MISNQYVRQADSLGDGFINPPTGVATLIRIINETNVLNGFMVKAGKAICHSDGGGAASLTAGSDHHLSTEQIANDAVGW